MSDAPQCLKSFYGAPNKNSVTTLIGSPKEGGRPQDILTPDYILNPIIEVWDGIALDPCGSKLRKPFAAETIYLEDGDPKKDGGLAYPWEDRTFVNPPYKYLKQWLMHAIDQEFEEVGRIAILCPVRSHRKWWRTAANYFVPICLNPIKFVGYKQTFPAPLCIMTNHSLLAVELEDRGLGERV